jgi:exodeoxyribonuclease V alpha subunit
MPAPDRGEPTQIAGKVVRTVYHDAGTRYTVLRLQLPGELQLTTVVGRTSDVEEGATVEASGRWIVHPTHGEQFEFDRLRVAPPKTAEGVRRRLMRYPGIREVMAQRIVDAFGADALQLLDTAPSRLLEVEGVGRKTLDRIMEYHATRSGPIVELENRLVELDLFPGLADRIHRRYRERALEMLEQHPYRLAREVKGIGFATADRIARALGVDLDSDERVDAGVVFVLERAQREGHCALPRGTLVHDSTRVLGLPPERAESGVDRLVDTGELILEDPTGSGEICFLREFVLAEEGVARALIEIAVADKPQWAMQGLPDHLAEKQVRSVEAIARNGVVVLTGGPGTGKSTVIRHVIEIARAHDSALMLCAPTGRAAKRLEQTTGVEARTVHRLLEIQGDTGEFLYGANNPLPPGLVVLDEASMLDIGLAEALFSSLTDEHRLMLVGDADQLPSVGPGNVLRDVIAAAGSPDSPIPVVRLDKIFRQDSGSSIVVNAHHVLHGRPLEPDPPGSAGQFFFTRVRDAERVHERVVTLAAERIPEVYRLDSVNDVQVVCPMHKGRAGTEAFNTALQARYTAEAPGVEAPGPRGGGGPRRFNIGDRVMQTRNDYTRGVFNGDIGAVTEVEDGGLLMDVDGVSVRCSREELAQLKLAYAISIHKSQGSEFPAVIVPLLVEHHVMLRRNLLYTAMTRAQRLCVLVGDPRAVERAVERADAAHRHTGLRRRLTSGFAEALGGVVYEPDPSAS